MRKIFVFLLALSALCARGQRSYDTTLATGDPQNPIMDVIITEPAWYTHAHLSTDSGGAIVYSGGYGEVGTDSSKVATYGPHNYMRTASWNGGIPLATDTIYPFIISTQVPASSGYWVAPHYGHIMDLLLAMYPIKRNSVSFLGISMGGWEGAQLIAYRASSSDSSFLNYVKSFVDIEGVKPDDADGAAAAYPAKFTPCAKWGIKLWFFEQLNDFRDGQTIVNTFNAAVAGSATWQSTNYNGGGHGEWQNEMGGNGNPTPLTYSFNGGAPETIYQFMARTWDTVATYHPITPTPPTANAGGTYNIDQSINGELILNGTGSSAPGGHSLSYLWRLPTTYTANDKTTPQTYLNGESQIAWMTDTTDATPHITGMKMICGDSVQWYKFPLQVKDNVTGLVAYDTAIVHYHYWAKYPPQNQDGAAGGHRATSGDCAALPANMQGGCTVGQDWFITGAQSDPVTDAGGVSHYTSFYQYPNFGDTARVAPGYRVWMNAGSHANGPYCAVYQLYDTAGGSGIQPLGDTLGRQIIWTYYSDGSTNLKSLTTFSFSNMRNVRITGDYDSINHIGLAAYPGARHGGAYTDTLYGIMVDNHFMSTAGASFQMEGISSQRFRFDHCASINGNFFGFQLKAEYANILNPTTRAQLYWNSDTVDNNYVARERGEAYYYCSANTPKVKANHLRFHDNRAAFCGNKAFKTLDLQDDNWVYNNTAIQVSIGWPTAFEEGVSVGQEASLAGHDNKIYNNMVYRYGNQGLNLLTVNDGLFLPSKDSIFNNAYVGGVGPIGFYIGQQDSAVTLNLFRNITGGYQSFLFNRAYKPGSYGTNTQFQMQALEAGGLPTGITVSTYNVSNAYADSTKTTLISSEGTVNLTSPTRVHALQWPDFVNIGLTPGTNVIQFCTRTFGTFGDEFPRGSDQKDTLMFYDSGMVVHWFGKLYQSKINGNTHYPTALGGTDPNWTLLTFLGGTTMAPNDMRLYKSDFYAQRGIGLTAQLDTSSFPTVNAGANQFLYLPTSSSTLVGSITIPGGTTLTSSTWTQVSGPNMATISNPSTLTTAISGLIQGVYTFKLSGILSNGNSGSALVSVYILTNCNCVTSPKQITF